MEKKNLHDFYFIAHVNLNTDYLLKQSLTNKIITIIKKAKIVKFYFIHNHAVFI